MSKKKGYWDHRLFASILCGCILGLSTVNTLPSIVSPFEGMLITFGFLVYCLLAGVIISHILEFICRAIITLWKGAEK
jgi:uncharacterized membrane protein